jgi:hypothetical protein
MMHLNFSGFETALLPYFLFVVYGSIALWVRGVQDSVEVTESCLAADRTDACVAELEVGDYQLSVPSPWEGDLMATEFDLEVRCRSVVPMTDEQVLAYIEIPRIEMSGDAKGRKARKRAAKSLSELVGLEFDCGEPTDES